MDWPQLRHQLSQESTGVKAGIACSNRAPLKPFTTMSINLTVHRHATKKVCFLDEDGLFYEEQCEEDAFLVQYSQGELYYVTGPIFNGARPRREYLRRYSPSEAFDMIRDGYLKQVPRPYDWPSGYDDTNLGRRHEEWKP